MGNKIAKKGCFDWHDWRVLVAASVWKKTKPLTCQCNQVMAYCKFPYNGNIYNNSRDFDRLRQLEKRQKIIIKEVWFSPSKNKIICYFDFTQMGKIFFENTAHELGIKIDWCDLPF